MSKESKDHYGSLALIAVGLLLGKGGTKLINRGVTLLAAVGGFLLGSSDWLLPYVRTLPETYLFILILVISLVCMFLLGLICCKVFRESRRGS